MPIGGAIAGGVGSIVGGMSAKKDSKRALKESNRQQQIVRDQAMPYVQQGTNALLRIGTPEAQAANFETSPGYNFRMDQGLDAIHQNKATAGLLRSGSNLKESMAFGQGLASQEFGNWFNREKSIADTGMQGINVQQGVSNTNSNTAFTNAANQTDANNAMINGVSGSLGMLFPKK